MLDQFEPRNPLYNVPRAWRLKGPLRVAALQRSLDEIVRRHESQRTTFGIRDGCPVQIILKTLHIPLATYDLAAIPPGEREEAVRRIVEDEMLRPFDLERGPLVRAYLVRLSCEDHVLLIVSHHIISDAWSAAVFSRELQTLYEAFSRGAVSPLPELELQYGDYAAYERQWLQGEVLEKYLAYWRQELAGAPPVLALPTDRPRSNARSFRGSCETVGLSGEISKLVKQLSRTEATTTFAVLMAAFQTLLWCYSGQTQIVVGTDVANRSAPEVESMLGFFVNILPIRTDFSGKPTFRDLLRRVRQCLLGAYAHQQFPFAKMVQEIQPGRGNRHNPLVQALFVFQNAPRTERALDGLQVNPFPLPVTSSKFDLAVFMAEGQDGLVGHWVYSTDLFERATILEISRRFQTLLEKIVVSPDTPLDNFDVLSVPEQSREDSERSQRGEDDDKLMALARPHISLEPEADVEHTPDRTSMEEAIMAIWCEVLERKRISVEENLFEIGGHSLIATQIAARLRSRLGLEIYVRMLFDHPTIRDLARAIDEGGNDLIASSGFEILPVPRIAAKE
jgi:acyl carrier protein